jgi:hypothetical protein
MTAGTIGMGFIGASLADAVALLLAHFSLSVRDRFTKMK